jgi:hypothetical protein
MATVVMAPGWEKKVLLAADPVIARVTARKMVEVKGNIVAGRHVVTGALLSSVRMSRAGLAHYRVWIGTDHWQYVEYGAAPHMIYPRGPWPLRFTIGPRQITTWSVSHPGNPEYAVVRRAFR